MTVLHGLAVGLLTSALRLSVSWSPGRVQTGYGWCCSLLWIEHLEGEMKHGVRDWDPRVHTTTRPQSLTKHSLTFCSCLTGSLGTGQINEVLERNEATVIREQSSRAKCHWWRRSFCVSHQVGHDDGSVRALTRHWVTPFSAFKDLKEKQVIGKLSTAYWIFPAAFSLSYHPKNSVRAAATLVHFRLSVVTILCRKSKEQFGC